MDDLDDLLASLKSGRGGNKDGTRKAKKAPAAVSDGRVKGTGKGAGLPADGNGSDHDRGKPEPKKATAVRQSNPAGVRADRPPAKVPPSQPALSAAETEKRLFGQHDKLQEKPGRLGYKGTMPPPFELAPRLPEHHPKKFKTGDLKNGDSVWYRGNQRYWLVDVQPFEKTSYVRVCSTAVRPGGSLPKDAEIFWVHADLLELAPVRGPQFVAQPTRHAVETREKMKAEGVTDIGDQVATMLRGKDLDEAYAIASKLIHVPEDELRAKYRKLNNGQQRMNLGNRMRGFLKKNGG